MALLGTVYRYENLINNKGYTGWATNLKRRKQEHLRLNGHCPHFHRALAKYGIDNFRFEILERNVPLEREKYWIAHFGDFENGYNLDAGGVGHTSWTVEQRQKLSKSVSGEKHPMYGKKHSQESLQKMSRAKLGKLGEKSNSTRPEYTQAKWEFFLLIPLGISMKEMRKHLHKKFNQVSYSTIKNWVRKWQLEL